MNLFDSLCTIIGDSIEHAFGCAIPLSAYDMVDREYALSDQLQPFPLAGMDAIKQVHMWVLRELRPLPFFSVFEDGDEHKGSLLTLAERALPPDVHHLDFMPKGIAPLQAADIAAWDMHNIVAGVERDIAPEKWGKSVTRLPRPEKEDYAIYTETDLRRLCDNLGILKRAS